MPYFNQFLGLERILNELEKSATEPSQVKSYPPHNIIKQSDTEYLVELAVAGFKLSELSITVEDGLLTIAGIKDGSKDEREFLYRGISAKVFKKTIKIVDTVVVKSATFVDGILSIHLENVIPESKKLKTIKIVGNYPELLAEKIPSDY